MIGTDVTPEPLIQQQGQLEAVSEHHDLAVRILDALVKAGER